MAWVQRSFAGGEIGIPLSARVDQPRARFGLRTCRNMIVMRSGALANRGGLRYLHSTKSDAAARLIPFVFNTGDSYAIEFGNGYVRFVRSAARLTVDGPAAHSTSVYYEPGDLVRTGASGAYAHYYCIAANVNAAPPNTDYWYALTMTDLDDTPTTGGVSILEVPSPFVAGELFDVRYVQSGDVVTLVHPSHPPYELTRWGATDWTLAQIAFAPPIRSPVDLAATAGGAAGNFTYKYKVTAVQRETYNESLVGSTARQEDGIASRGAAIPADIRVTTAAAHGIVATERVFVSEVNCLSGTPDAAFIAQLVGKVYIVSAATATTFDLDGTDVLTIPGNAGDYEVVVTALDAPAVFGAANGGNTAPLELLDAGHGLATGDEIFCIGVLTTGGAQPENPIMVRELTGHTFRITVIDASNFRLDGTSGIPNGGAYGTHDVYYTPTHVTLANVKVPKPPIPGDGVVQIQHTITWGRVEDAEEYWVYKEKDGVFGYLGTAYGTSFVDEGQEPDMSKVPPVYRNPFLEADSYPQAVGYVQQRQCFAGSNAKPQTVLMSKTGDFKNFTTRSPLEDDDSIEFTVAGQRAYRIRHLTDLEQLLVHTSGSELIARGDQDGVIRPTAINLSTVGNSGASNVAPIVAGQAVLFAQARGSQVIELADTAEGRRTRDLSTWAPHLVDGYTITDWAWSQSPYSCAWAVRSDGALLGLTYVPTEDIAAWHRHDTAGVGADLFESVCVVPEGNEDVVYVVVKRTINSATVRYIERMAERREGLYSAGSNQSTITFLDSYKTYTASANGSATVTGLGHLEAEVVYALRDGVVVGPFTVTGGQITVVANWSLLVVGIQINADVETHSLDQDESDVSGRKKGVAKATLLVNQSRAFYAGPTSATADLRQYPMPTGSAATALHTGPADITLPGGWDVDRRVFIRHNNPLPFTLLGLIVETKVGGMQ